MIFISFNFYIKPSPYVFITQGEGEHINNNSINSAVDLFLL